MADKQTDAELVEVRSYLEGEDQDDELLRAFLGVGPIGKVLAPVKLSNELVRVLDALVDADELSSEVHAGLVQAVCVTYLRLRSARCGRRAAHRMRWEDYAMMVEQDVEWLHEVAPGGDYWSHITAILRASVAHEYGDEK